MCPFTSSLISIYYYPLKPQLLLNSLSAFFMSASKLLQIEGRKIIQWGWPLTCNSQSHREAAGALSSPPPTLPRRLSVLLSEVTTSHFLLSMYLLIEMLLAAVIFTMRFIVKWMYKKSSNFSYLLFLSFIAVIIIYNYLVLLTDFWCIFFFFNFPPPE